MKAPDVVTVLAAWAVIAVAVALVFGVALWWVTPRRPSRSRILRGHLDAADPCPECNAPLRVYARDEANTYCRCDRGHAYREERGPWAVDCYRTPESDEVKP